MLKTPEQGGGAFFKEKERGKEKYGSRSGGGGRGALGLLRSARFRRRRRERSKWRWEEEEKVPYEIWERERALLCTLYTCIRASLHFRLTMLRRREKGRERESYLSLFSSSLYTLLPGEKELKKGGGVRLVIFLPSTFFDVERGSGREGGGRRRMDY